MHGYPRMHTFGGRRHINKRSTYAQRREYADYHLRRIRLRRASGSLGTDAAPRRAPRRAEVCCFSSFSLLVFSKCLAHMRYSPATYLMTGP